MFPVNYSLGSRIAFKSSIFVILSFILFCFGYKSASACTPVPITPWFDEKLSFVESNLPPTINHFSDQTFSNSEDSHFFFQDHGETKDIGTQFSFQVFVVEDSDGIEINDSIFSEFEHRNKIGDNRPENTQPPSYQDVIIPVTLNEKQYDIKLRITYEINQNYNPKSIEMQNIKCSFVEPFWQYCLNIPVIVGLAFLLTLGAVVIIRRKNLQSNLQVILENKK
jgi:hypothetical protein